MSSFYGTRYEAPRPRDFYAGRAPLRGYLGAVAKNPVQPNKDMLIKVTQAYRRGNR